MTIRSSVISCDLADRMPNFTVVSKRELIPANNLINLMHNYVTT